MMIFTRTAVLLSALSFASGALATDDREKSAYERQLSSVNALMVALKSDPKSSDASVKATIDQVAARQREAADLAAAGEHELAKSILNEGYSALTATLSSVKSGSGYAGASGSMSGTSGMTGMTGADGQPVALTKMKSDYDHKLRSAESMQDAARRANPGSNKEISAIDGLIAQAQLAARKDDYVTANRYLDDGLNRQKTLFSKSSTPSATSSAKPPDADDSIRDMTGMTGDDKKRAITGQLRTTKTLRDAYERKCKEKGSDCTANLAKIDQMAGAALSLESTDLGKSLLVADEAYALAKSSLAAQRAGH